MSLLRQKSSARTQKVVELPSEPQTKPLETDDTLGYETDAGVRVRTTKSPGERMSKSERERAGYKRLTAYCVAEAFKMKSLAGFLKREHNVFPRVFDEAMYVMYHLPLLPGYTSSNIRSSVAPKSKSIMSHLSEAEEEGYQGSYFRISPPSSPIVTRQLSRNSGPFSLQSEADTGTETETETGQRKEPVTPSEDQVAEVVFFEYGVFVFFGFDEGQERSIIDDIENAGIMSKKLSEDNWEIEECHYTHDPHIAYPRIYNDFFTPTRQAPERRPVLQTHHSRRSRRSPKDQWLPRTASNCRPGGEGPDQAGCEAQQVGCLDESGRRNGVNGLHQMKGWGSDV